MRPRDKAEIARRFKALRLNADLTQSYLAGLIGVCRQAVWEIEHERTLPHFTTWGRFAILEAKRLAETKPAVPSGPWE